MRGDKRIRQQLPDSFTQTPVSQGSHKAPDPADSDFIWTSVLLPSALSQQISARWHQLELLSHQLRHLHPPEPQNLCCRVSYEEQTEALSIPLALTFHC